MTPSRASREPLVVVVTGAARGIGESIAAAFARGGAHVVVADVDEAGALAVAERLASDRLSAIACPTDVGNAASVDALFERARTQFGRVDVVVNNAGLVHVTKFEDVSLAEWRRVFGVNADGVFLMTRRAGVVMREQSLHPGTQCRGKIVNISSRAAEHGRPLLAAYGASKAALNHVSMTAALVFADSAISTTVVYPGNIREGMWRDLGPRIANLEQRAVEEVEEERVFQSPDDFAGGVVDVAEQPGMGLNGAIVDLSTGMPIVRDALQ